MAKTAEEFLKTLADAGLVPGEILQQLRSQVARAAKPVSPAMIAKVLVQHGHLTPAQSQRLLGTAAAAPTAPAAKTSPLTPLPATAPFDSSGLAPPEELSPLTPLDLNVGGLVPLEVASLLAQNPQKPPTQQKPPLPKPAPFRSAPPVQPTTQRKPTAAAPSATPALEAQVLEPVALEDVVPAAPAAAGPLAAAAVPSKQPVRSRRGMWIAAAIGGAVIVALGIGAVALLMIPRGNPDEAFLLAEQDYQARNYAAAAAKYDDLLTKFPRHERAGLARVHRGLARMLAAAATPNPNWPEVLPVAREVLAEIDAEPELPQSRAELAPLLVDLASGLADAAKNAKTPEETAARLADAREALALAADGHYVPAELRPWQRLRDVEESLQVVERGVQRQKSLAAALGAIEKVIAAENFEEAYQERSKLLVAFPELAAEDAIRALGNKLALAETARVKPEKLPGDPVSGEIPSPVVASLLLAHRDAIADEKPGEPIFFRFGSVAVALDAASGKLLWRRPLGKGLAIDPVRLSADSSADALLVARGELVRVEGSSGATRWRLLLPGAAAGVPTVAGSRIYVALRDGKILAFDADSGKSLAAARMPLPIGVPPAVSADGQYLYQPAEHSHLFVVSAEDMTCRRAIYLGHEPGGVEVSPVVVGGTLVVAENRGITSELHLLSLDDDGLASKVQKSISLPGHLLTPPIVLGTRLIVMTDQGEAVVFTLDRDAREPVAQNFEGQLEPAGLLARFGVGSGNQLWIAGDGLRQYSLAADGKLQETWKGIGDGIVESPPQSSGDVLVSLRRDPAGAGAVASGISAGSRKVLWETRLAAPLIGDVTMAETGSSATIASGLGRMAKIDLSNWQEARVLEVPLGQTDAKTPVSFAAGLALPEGSRLLVTGGSDRQLFVLGAASGQPEPLPLAGPLAGLPIVCGESVVAATTTGTICWLDPQAKKTRALFQLPLRLGSRLGRCEMAVAGDDGREIVVAVGTKVFHLELAAEPQPHLVELARADLHSPVDCTPAVIGRSLYLADEAGNVLLLELPGLKAAKTWALGARTFGVWPVGERIFLANDLEQLVCIDGGDEPRFRKRLSRGPIAGAPVVLEGDLLVATTNGWLCRLAVDTGEEVATAHLHQPLAGRPVVAGSFLLVPAADGTLLKVRIPTPPGGQP